MTQALLSLTKVKFPLYLHLHHPLHHHQDNLQAQRGLPTKTDPIIVIKENIRTSVIHNCIVHDVTKSIAISTLVQKVLNKMMQNKNKSFMKENYIIWEMFKWINPNWGFIYPTGNISSWNLSKAKNLHDFAKCHCSSMCKDIVYFYWAQLTALSNLEALQKQMQNGLQFEFLNHDTFEYSLSSQKLKCVVMKNFLNNIIEWCVQATKFK